MRILVTSIWLAHIGSLLDPSPAVHRQNSAITFLATRGPARGRLNSVRSLSAHGNNSLAESFAVRCLQTGQRGFPVGESESI